MEKKIAPVLFCLIVGLAFLLPPVMVNAANIKSQDVAGTPNPFAKVIKEPNPRLIGGWQCTWQRYRAKQGKTDVNPIEFWLVKRDNRYGLYFYRFKAEENRRYSGWKDWTINGDEIISGTGVRFFTDGTDVFFQWESDKPTKMSPIEGSR